MKKLFLTFLLLIASLNLYRGRVHGNRSFRPNEIIQKMVEKYAEISSYQDEGYVEATSIAEADKQSYRRYFKTYFVRPDIFRFELRYQFGPKDPEKFDILVSEEKQSYVSSDGKRENIENIGEGIAKLAGVSLGSSHFVPSLLFKLKNQAILSDLKNIKFEKTELKNGEYYWVISGKHPRRETFYELWIRKKDFLLYKLKYKIGHLGHPVMIEEIHLNISINHIVPEEYSYKQDSWAVSEWK